VQEVSVERAVPGASRVGAFPVESQEELETAGQAQSGGKLGHLGRRLASDPQGESAGFGLASFDRKLGCLRRRAVSGPQADSVPELPCPRAGLTAQRGAPTSSAFSFFSLFYKWKHFSSRNGLPPRASSSESPMPGNGQELARRAETLSQCAIEPLGHRVVESSGHWLNSWPTAFQWRNNSMAQWPDDSMTQ